MLSAEISTIYRRGEHTRKIHHLAYAPTLKAAARITAALSRIGNLASDGRPILGLDSRDLLEIVLDGGPGCYLVPAHVWTPWFAVLGSKSGFDLVADCYADLAPEIFAIETGLSSDPAMNWQCSSLDGYRLVSNSDAHSPPMLGREATTFGGEPDYFAMAAALRTGNGLIGTIEFYPEEGKYHLDGHRKCAVRFEPAQTIEADGICPECGRPLTVGVLHRVAELADRPSGYRPAGAPGFTNLVQLPQVVSEIMGTGPKSKKVGAEVSRLVAAFGPELAILTDIPVRDLAATGGSLLAEAITRLRAGQVRREAGYDGEYGSVRLFAPGELDRSAALFEVTRSPGLNGRPERLGAPGPGGSSLPGDASPPAKGGPALSGRLDPDQLAAVTSGSPLMIIAGPGTGKTLTLASRIAQQIAAGAAPGACLAITFTRRAAGELRDRLAALGTPGAAQVCVTTFHGLGLLILRDEPQRAGLTGDFQIADEATLAGLAAELAGSPRAGRRLLAEAAADPGRRAELVTALRARDLVDFDGLIELPVALLRGDLALAARLRGRWRSISVDEYQDIDAAQYELLRLLAGDGARLTAIGDPDQAIYGFRGADVGFFLRFGADYPGATQLQLSRNYRASGSIVAGALQAIAPDTLAPGRVLRAVRPGGPPITVHEAADEHAEAAWIAAVVDGLLGGSSFHSIDSGRVDGRGQDGLSLRDVAVLYRTDGQTAVLGQALTRAGLPFQKGSHDLLGRRSGVQEIIGQLRLAQAAPVATDGTGGVVRRLRAAVRGLVAGRSGAAATDIRAAGEILLPLARRCSDDLDLFLAEISLGAQADALDPRADAVTLLTLHAAKGLEFEAVFLAGCERGLLPLWLPGADRDLAEERRLLFVGMSRARSRLFLSYAARRARRGGAADAGPSPFLADLDPALLRRPAPPRPRRPASQQLRLL